MFELSHRNEWLRCFWTYYFTSLHLLKYAATVYKDNDVSIYTDEWQRSLNNNTKLRAPAVLAAE